MHAAAPKRIARRGAATCRGNTADLLPTYPTTTVHTNARVAVGAQPRRRRRAMMGAPEDWIDRQRGARTSEDLDIAAARHSMATVLRERLPACCC